MARSKTTRPQRLPRTLKVTREGRYYLGVTLGIGFAAVNTGNNLLFLTLGMLLSLIILSGLLSEAALKRVEIGRILPRECRDGEPAIVELTVHNGNRMLPAMGLVVVEAGLEDAEATAARAPMVSAGTTVRTRLRLTPKRRGEIHLPRLRVTTSYPFGIFAKTREIGLPATVVAFPARVQATAGEAASGRGEAGSAVLHRGGGEDFHGLRGFRDGDEARHIHWRSSLRTGTLLVAEREAPRGRRVTVVLDSAKEAVFEEAVRWAAARVEAHLARGDEVSLEGPALSVPFDHGPAHRTRLLTALALAEPAGAKEAA